LVGWKGEVGGDHATAAGTEQGDLRAQACLRNRPDHRAIMGLQAMVIEFSWDAGFFQDHFHDPINRSAHTGPGEKSEPAVLEETPPIP
jgi:hypothetical protein